MAGIITIDPDVITAHAARVDQVADDIGVARSAGGSSNMGGGAFGIMCAFLVPAAQLVSSMAMGSITSAEQLIKRSATELRGVVQDYTELEQALSKGLDEIKSAID